jgi:hypothetical protein
LHGGKYYVRLNAVQIVESFWADVVCEFQTRVAGLEFETVESFQNAGGIRVASQWRVRGRNHGFLGLPPDQRALEMPGTAG